MITLTLPYPPSLNNLYATVNGRRVLSAKGRDYHARVVDSVYGQVGTASLGQQRVAYTATVFPPDRRRRDLSNVIKCVEDALTKAGIWVDDSQVDDMRWIRSHVAPGGSLFLEINAVGDEP